MNGMIRWNADAAQDSVDELRKARTDIVRCVDLLRPLLYRLQHISRGNGKKLARLTWELKRLLRMLDAIDDELFYLRKGLENANDHMSDVEMFLLRKSIEMLNGGEDPFASPLFDGGWQSEGYPGGHFIPPWPPMHGPGRGPSGDPFASPGIGPIPPPIARPIPVPDIRIFISEILERFPANSPFTKYPRI